MPLRILFSVTYILILPLPVLAGMQSENYNITTSVLSGGGTSMTSDNYQTDGTLGQSSPLMDPADPPYSSSYELYPGFWYSMRVGGLLIVSIRQDWEETFDVTVTWESKEGQEYDVFLKDNLSENFEIVDTVVATDPLTSWTDDGLWTEGSHPKTVEQRYYKVVHNGRDSNNTVGMFRVVLHEGMNLCGLPLVPMVSSLEGVLGGQLTGADNERDADRLWTWNATNYEIAWLVEGVGPPYDGTWYTGSAPTTISMGPDQGFWVQVREGHGDTDLFLLGELSLTDRIIPLDPGMNLVAPSAPITMPLGDQALDDANLWESGAIGADNERDADRVWNWTGTNYQFHWLVYGVGPLYDGLWYTGNNPSSLWIEPGKGYWVQIREEHDGFDWVYPMVP